MSPVAITHYCAEWVRSDMTLRPGLSFLVGSIRNDIKACQAKRKPVSCPGELPAESVHGKMEKKWDVGVSVPRYALCFPLVGSLRIF